jgi:hypothetical protein
MQITLESLSRVLEPISSIGQEEATFEVNGLTVAMRVLTPEQEAEVQKFANEVFATKSEGDSEDTARGMEYLERFRLAVVSHAICAIGDTDLRNVVYVETGEKLPNGVAVKVPTATALRNLITRQRWSGTIRLGLFRKYGEIVSKVEKKSEAAIEFEPSDTEAEIERLEARIAILRKEKEDKNAPLLSSVSGLVKEVVAQDTTQQQEAQENLTRLDAMREDRLAAQEAGPAQEPSAETPPWFPEATAPEAPASPVARQPVTPKLGKPPARTAPVAAPQPTPPPPAPAAPALTDSTSSFIDTDDVEASAEAVAMENQRLFHARKNRGNLPAPPSGLNQVLAQQEVPPTALRPTEELVRPAQPAAPPMSLDQAAPAQGTTNPRFRKPPHLR